MSSSIFADEFINFADEFIDFVDEFIDFCGNNRDKVIIDFHDYTVGSTKAQQMAGFPDVLLNLDAMRAGITKPFEWNSGNIRETGQWHLGRHAPLINRARKRGKFLRMGLGECFMDNMNDIDHVVDVMKDYINRNFITKDIYDDENFIDDEHEEYEDL